MAATTTAVDVGTPPVPPAAVVDPPRPPRTEIAGTVPMYTLPDTGSRTTEAIAVLAMLVVLLGGLGVLLGRGPADYVC